MKEISPVEFLKWCNEKEVEEPVAVIIGGPACPKCIKLSSIIDTKKWASKVVKFVQNTPKKGSGYDETAKVLQKLEISAVPAVLYKNECDDIISKPWEGDDPDLEFDTWFTAIIDKDKEFFGTNEYNEIQSPLSVDAQSVRLIDKLHGGVDINKKAEHDLMRRLFSPGIALTI
jgi:hypothetical protein